MPGADDREPGDPNRPSVGEVGREMQEEVDDAGGTKDVADDAGGEHPAPSAVEDDGEGMTGEAPTG
jgi:hypothetical protein